MIVFSTPEATDNLFQESTNSPFRFLDQLGGRRWGGFCLAHAFTNQDFAEGVVGLANVGTICRAPTNGFTSSGSGLTVFSTNTGITTTVNFGSTNSELQTLLVFAHEVGHNFGMPVSSVLFVSFVVLATKKNQHHVIFVLTFVALLF